LFVGGVAFRKMRYDVHESRTENISKGDEDLARRATWRNPFKDHKREGKKKGKWRDKKKKKKVADRGF